jgi:hypothetical protein
MLLEASNLSGLEIFIALWTHSTFSTKQRIIGKMKIQSESKLGFILEDSWNKFVLGNSLKDTTEI